MTVRKTALSGRNFSSSADAACRIVEAAPASRLSVRGRGGVEGRTVEALGLALPTAVCSSVKAGDIAALWISPDEWLVLGPDGKAAELFAKVDKALDGLPHAVTDISHRNTAIEVSGPKATFVINHGCPLDLDLAHFPVGMSTRTVLAKSEIILWRTGATSFHIEVWRSFAAYLTDYLIEARREFEV